SDVDVIFVAEPGGPARETGSVGATEPAAGAAPAAPTGSGGGTEPGGPGEGEGAALTAATRVASDLMRVCGEVAWQVDANLRPEGRAGPLVRTLASHQAYYRRWARTWEFQALLKARPVAGDRDLADRYIEMLAPLVWSASERPDFVQDVQVMRRRVEEHLPAAVAAREGKLGPGGLRAVEFAVRLLQLVHGRAGE